MSPRTQDLEPVQFINFIICVFDKKSALANYEKYGNFLYRGKIDFIETPDDEAIDIDYEMEFRMMEALMESGAKPKPAGNDPAPGAR
jgi:CMP-N-acetylneuraminic acid synthetase